MEDSRTTYTHGGAADVEERQMVGASCFLPSWQWAHMETLKDSHFHVSTCTHTQRHTHLVPMLPAGSSRGHCLTFPKDIERHPGGHLRHPGAVIRVTCLHHSPGCQHLTAPAWRKRPLLLMLHTSKKLQPPPTATTTDTYTLQHGAKWAN